MRNIPWQEIGDLVDRIVGKVREHVAQIGLRIEAVYLRHIDQTVNCSGALPATVRAKEQKVIAAIESLNSVRRSATKCRKLFPSDDSVLAPTEY